MLAANVDKPPLESLEQRLTRQFYEWELWGRGRSIWDVPVELEPPFHPFFGHFVQGPPRISDDGRKPTFLSKLTDRFFGGNQTVAAAPPVPDDDREPFVFHEGDDELVEIEVSIPPDLKTFKDAAAQFLWSLGKCSRPLSFEIIGSKLGVSCQFTCGAGDRFQLVQQLRAFFPDALLSERKGFLEGLWHQGSWGMVIDYGLASEFMRPIRGFAAFDPDPLAALVSAMEDLADDEAGVLQVLFIPTINPWVDSIIRAVTDGQGGPFFRDDDQMLVLAGQKIASPLFATVIRIAATSNSHDRACNIGDALERTLAQLDNPQSNELIPIANDHYDDAEHAHDLIRRRSRRCGMILSSEELLSLVHLPSVSVRSPSLKRDGHRVKTAPAIARGHRFFLGDNIVGDKIVPVSQNPSQRSRHTYLIGASGTGKSTMLLNMIVQDISSGEGLAVLDPHGDLIDQIASRIPEERITDVVYLDPADEEFPIGFNILSAETDAERTVLASDLVSAFRRLSTSWGDQMTTVLGNAVMALLESDQGGTLSDLRRFLVEPEFRSTFLKSVRDPAVRYYWSREFPLLTGRPQGSILARLDTFLRPKVIRNMVSQKANRLNFNAMMNGRKILLAKLSQGLIGEENSYLLGTLIVSKINQAAMARQNVEAANRTPFYLYVDEFHNFITPSLASILSGARKFNLGLILAHQELHQLARREAELTSAVLSNPYTRICFRLGDLDAKKLEEGFSFFTAKDLQNLGLGEAVCRVERSDYDFNLAITPLPELEPALADQRRTTVISSSRSQNASRRADVEEILRQELPMDEVTPPKNRRDKDKPPSPAPPIAETAQPEVPVQEVTRSAVPGKGGQQHKYIQQLIKRWAEERGYTVSIEKPILDGLGSVDVALEKGTTKIAFEICVTTSPEHELGNVQKCLAAGFVQVVSVATEQKTLQAVRASVWPELNANQRKQLQFLTPEQVFTFLDGLEVKTPVQPAKGNKEILTAKELEELLRIDVKTIYSYAQRGLIPYVRIQSNLRFVRSEVLAWLEKRQFEPREKGRK